MAQEVASVYGKIGADLSGWNSGLKKMQGGIGNASQSLKSLGTGAMKVGGVMTAGLTAPIAAMGGKMFGMAAEFESELNVMALAASSSGTSLDELRDAAIKVGGDTELVGISAAEAAEAMTNFYKAGMTTEQMFGDLNGYMTEGASLTGAMRAAIDLQAASELNLADASDLVTVAMATYGIGAEDATQITSNFVKAADASVTSVPELAAAMKNAGSTFAGFGYSLEDTNTALALLSSRGIAGAEAGTAVKSMMTNMMRTSAPTVEALQELGIVLYDQEGALKSLPTLMGEFETALSGVTQEEKNQYVQAIAGTYGMKAFNTLLAEGSGGWTAMEEAIGGAADTQAAAGARTKGLAAAWENLQGVIETVILQGTSPFMQSVAGIVSKLADLISGLSELDPIWFKIAGGIALAVAAAGPIVTAFGAIATVLGFILSPVGLIVAGIVALGAAFVKSQGGIKPAIARLKEFGKQIMGRVAPAIDRVKSIVDTVKQKGLLGALFKEDTLKTIKQLWAVLSGGAQRAFGILQGIVATVVPFVGALLADMGTFFQEKFGVIIDWVRENLPLIQQTITTVLNTIQSVWTTVWPYLQQVILIVWNIIKTIISGAIENIGNIIKAVMQAINGDWSGAWETIKTALATAWETIKTVVSTAINGVLALLGTDMDTLKSDMATKWEEIKTNIATKWEEFKTTIATKLTEIKTNVLTKWTEIKTDIATKLTEIATNISTKWQEFKTSISTKLTEIKTDITTKWGEIKTAIGEKLEEIKTLISDKLTEAKDAIADKVDEFKSVGSDLMQGMIQGVKDKVGDLISAATGVVSDAISAAKALLGIHSPSTVFWEIGENMMKGWANGISEGDAEVVKKLAKAIDKIMSAFKKMFEVTEMAGGDPGNIPDLTPWIDRMDAMFMQVASKLDNIMERLGYKRIKKLRKVASNIAQTLELVTTDFSGIGDITPIDVTGKFEFIEDVFNRAATMVSNLRGKWSEERIEKLANMVGSIRELIDLVAMGLSVGEISDGFLAALPTWADTMDAALDEMITRLTAIEAKFGAEAIELAASIASSVKSVLDLLAIDLNVTAIEDGWLATFTTWLDTFDQAVRLMVDKLQALSDDLGAEAIDTLAGFAESLSGLVNKVSGTVETLRSMTEGGNIDVNALSGVMDSLNGAAGVVGDGAETASGNAAGAGTKTLKIILDATKLGAGVKEITTRLDNLQGQIEDIYMDLALDGATP